MKRLVRKLALVSAVAAALVLAAFPSDAHAGRGRGRAKGTATRPASGGAVAVSGRATYGSAPTRVSGRATYGYYSGGYSYPVYGYPSSYWWYWGWPYYGYWAYWGWPYYYRPYAPPKPGPARNSPALVETDIWPKKAEVLLDDVPVGQARDYNGNWDSLAVKPGRHLLEFRHPGYMSLRLNLDARPGGQYRITELLQEGEGIDPRSEERQPEPAVEQPAAVQPRAAPAAAPSEPSRETGSLVRGLLRVSASPPDAAVYLDGDFLARADELSRMHGALPVAVGRHVIEVVRPGFKAQRVEVEVDGEQPAKISVDLAPQGQE